jgi:hypothetical protein
MLLRGALPGRTMNQTASISSPDFSNASQQFSRANLFGIFLTLQLCQFTQPYGSLLFRGRGGLVWRCNPIASFTEACIIVWHLVRTAYNCIREGPGLYRATHRALQWKRLRETIRETASGLLLLRGHMKDPPDCGLLERRLSGNFLLDNTTAGDHEEITHEIRSRHNSRSAQAPSPAGLHEMASTASTSR